MFEKAYLESDSYLSGVMVSNYGIPFAALVNAPAIKAITSNANTIKSAVYESQNCFLDKDTAVRPWKRAEANTLILRDISSATTSNDDILAIFSSDSGKGACPAPVSVRAEMNDTWFVVFASEADCKEALLVVNLQKRELAGKKVQARLKTTSAKPIYTGPSAAVLPGGNSLASPYGSFNDGYFPGGINLADPAITLDGVHMFQGMPIYPQSSMQFPIPFSGAQMYGVQGQVANGFLPNMVWPLGIAIPQNLSIPSNSPKYARQSGNGYPAGGGYQGGRGNRAGQSYTGGQKRDGSRSRSSTRGESLGDGPANMGNLAGADAGVDGRRHMDQVQWNSYGMHPQQPIMDVNGMMYPPPVPMMRAEGSTGRSGGRGGRGAGGRGGHNTHSVEGSPNNRGNSKKLSPRSQQRGSGDGDMLGPGPLMAQGMGQDERSPTNNSANGNGAGGHKERQKPSKDKLQQQSQTQDAPQAGGAHQDDTRAPGPGKKVPAVPVVPVVPGTEGAPAAAASQQKRHPQQKTEQAGDASASTSNGAAAARGVGGEAPKKKNANTKQNAGKTGEGAKGSIAKAKHAPAQPEFNMERDFPTTLGTSAGAAADRAVSGTASGSVAESSAASESTSAISGWAAIARRAQSDAGNQATAAAIQQATGTAPAPAKQSAKAVAAVPPAAAPAPVAAPVHTTAPTAEAPAIIFGSFGSPAESASPVTVPASATAPAKPVSTSSQGTQTATSDKMLVLTARQPHAQPTAGAAIATVSTSTTTTTTAANTSTNINTVTPAAAPESSAADSTAGGAWGVKRSFADVMKVGK